MKVLLTTAGAFAWNDQYLQEVKNIAAQDRVGIHQLTESSEAADIILFMDFHQHQKDWWMGVFHRHPLVKKYPQKVFVYDERDHPWYTAPGVYVSLPKPESDPRCQRGGCYFTLKNETIGQGTSEQGTSQPENPDLLFSFLGAMSHPLRRRVAALSHPRALVEDTSHLRFFGSGSPDLQQQKERYREVLLRSKFVLCPRGEGTSSFRLFETLSLGRVPVIISDDWVEPQGPNWSSCSLRVPESQVAQIPVLLAAKEASFEAMSHQASQVWHEWFAPEVRFHSLVEACVSVSASRCRGPRRFPMLRAQVLRYGLRLLKWRIKRLINSKRVRT